MHSDFEIGRVVAIDTSQVTIELNPDLKAMTRSTYETTLEVGRINSYVIIPIGARRIVAMITRVVMTEEAELRTDKIMVSLPSARRLMKATMIGTIDDKEFNQGISLFPVLDTPVSVATKDDLEAIFGSKKHYEQNKDAEKPGYCISIGKSVVFPNYEIKINPDVFFGKHAAIIGSTGSGKSCSIATLIQSIFDCPEVKNTTIIILDTNGEYRTAFQAENDKQAWNDVNKKYRCLLIPTDPNLSYDRLVIPYWFMNSEDFIRLFQASKGVQRPVLLEALRIARSEGSEKNSSTILREEIILEMNRIWALSGKDEKTSKDIRDLCNGLLNRIESSDLTSAWTELTSKLPSVTKESLKNALLKVKSEAEKHIDDNKYPKIIPADSRVIIRNLIDPIYTQLTGTSIGQAAINVGISADNPAFFNKQRFRIRHIEQVLRREESGGARARDYSGTMLLRIDRLLADNRFEFLFGTANSEWTEPCHCLATFLRDIFGLPSTKLELCKEDKIKKGIFPFYDRQRSVVKDSHNVIIIDLSLLASEVLENVTALIGRLILEFLQRASETELSEIKRGEFPVVLVLEEAQNYIHVSRGQEDESISREIFERIAREGRKFGLSLVVASQRPSELSKTVLSQCNSFIVHRLQNPEDLRYFREIVPGIYNQLLEQLPALAPRNALVLGEAINAPALVYMREANPTPQSKDPKFYKQWISESPKIPNVEKVCAKWEGKTEDNKN